MNESISPPPSRFRIAAIIAGIGCLILLIAPVIFVFWPRVTEANFEKITDQMSFQEVERLLGTPSYDTTELGLVRGSGTYVTNDSLPIQKKIAMGYQDYRRVQWSSRQLTIIVIFDSSGIVATRYRSDGQSSGSLW